MINNLPDLPTKHKHKEADFGTKVFRPWVLANANSLFSCTFELKDSYGKDCIPFNAVEDIQVDASQSIKWGKNGYLIRNQSGTPGAPDYSYFKSAPAFLVFNYGRLGFVLIDIETFVLEKKRSKRKSLTFERACDIAWKVVKLKKG